MSKSKRISFVASLLLSLLISQQAGVAHEFASPPEDAAEVADINIGSSIDPSLSRVAAERSYWLPALATAQSPLAPCPTLEAAAFVKALWCPTATEPLQTQLEATNHDAEKAAQEAAEARRAAVAHQETVSEIIEASVDSGADPALMLSVAWLESGFDSKSKNTRSSATGLYQFTNASWVSAVTKFGKKHGLVSPATFSRAARVKRNARRVSQMRRSPRLSVALAAEAIKTETQEVESRIGHPLSKEGVYLTHVLGAHGAEIFLAAAERDPDEFCSVVIPVAARGNPGLFGSTKKPLTVGEAMAKLHRRLNGVYGAMSGIVAGK